MVHVIRKEYIKTSLHPSKNTQVLLSPYLVCPILALPLIPRLFSSTKLLLLFVTSDKWYITKRSSSYHHTSSQKHQQHHLYHLKKKTLQQALVKVRAQNHQVKTGGELCDQFWWSFDTSHQQMVQMTTKIIMHVLKLLHDISKGDSGSR